MGTFIVPKCMYVSLGMYMHYWLLLAIIRVLAVVRQARSVLYANTQVRAVCLK